MRHAIVLGLALAACNVPATHFTPGDGGATTGGDGGAGAPASLSLSPGGDVALGTVIIGMTSAKTSVTVSNDGDEASGALALAFDDTTLGFAVTDDTCTGTVLAGHTTCTFAMTFMPSTSAQVQTNLHATASPGGDASKVVSGTGLVQGAIDITDASYTFPNQGLGATAGTKVFTIRNTGQSPLGIPMPTISGDATSYTVKSTTCNAMLAQTDTCTVTVDFGPTTVGGKAGSLVVTSTPGGSDAAQLSGTGFAHVTVTPGGSGVGTVTSSPAGISCPGTCAADFTSSPITLTAAANNVSTFTSWANDCTGGGSCQLTLNAAKNVTANFTIDSFGVTVGFTSINTTGQNTITSSPAGINCNGSTGCSGSFPYGSSVSITANPDNTWGRFTSWSSGPCLGSTNPVCTFTVPNATTTLQGSFNWFATLTITSNQGDAGGGFGPLTSQVFANDSTINCTNTTTLTGTCSNHYPRGGTLNLTYEGNPTTTWTNCKGGANQKFVDVVTSAGACTPPAGIICSQSSCAGTESCSVTFNTPGDFVSTYDVACEM